VVWGANESTAIKTQLQKRGGRMACYSVEYKSRKGNCYDNDYIESLWSSLKYEVVCHRRFQTRAGLGA
jgi:hypothetical protein